MKTWLGCKRFSSNEKMIVATNEYFEGFDENYFLEGIKIKSVLHFKDLIEPLIQSRSILAFNPT